jgi:hypothetical protein
MTNTPKNPGSSLRDKVASILKISGKKVDIEYRLECTTADVYYVQRLPGDFKLRVAVECKDWNKSLTSSDLAEIYNLYSPSFLKSIDQLWIVSSREIEKQPADTLSKLGNTRHFTYEQFLAEIMDFALLLDDNIASFNIDDASQNFLHLCGLNSSKTLEMSARDWLSSDKKAFFIYGGYGLGKTTFSKYICAKLTKEYRDGIFGRIPIRISLGSLYDKQDIRSLICSHLTGSEANANVGNFSYNVFMQMVQEGIFVIILDGFDEMKHAMTHEQFSFTFEQMRPLFQGASKTIVLGRPDSFFSDEEEEDLISNLITAVSGPIDQIEKIEISPLSDGQVRDYLNNFAQMNNLEKNEISYDDFGAQEKEILSRPVQLNMYTKIFSKKKFSRKSFTRYSLYKSFIYEFVRREQSKSARHMDFSETQVIGTDDPRTVFMQNVAWWVLTEKKENRFTAHEIPVNCLHPDQIIKGKMQASLREAIIGSVIEKIASTSSAVDSKTGSVFYFPHKSYFEFLVAEYFNRQNISKKEFASFFSNANKEILSFIIEGGTRGLQNLRLGLENVRGPVSRDFFRAACVLSEFSNSDFVVSKNTTPQDIILRYENLLLNNAKLEIIDDYILSAFKTSVNVKRFLSSLIILYEHLNKNNRHELAKNILLFTIESLDENNIEQLFASTNLCPFRIYDNKPWSLRSRFLSECVTFNQGSAKLDVRNIWILSEEISGSSFKISDFQIDQDGAIFFDIELDNEASIRQQTRSIISKSNNQNLYTSVLY